MLPTPLVARFEFTLNHSSTALDLQLYCMYIKLYTQVEDALLWLKIWSFYPVGDNVGDRLSDPVGDNEL